MTEITLRAYIREIDSLIEQEKLDEAIAHCRHLLQRHPKYIECYRLLGKAYLEAKRFGDAADIFQRVLSTVPDDFVSHIGMSIVREDEGNLDSAIWHMERAFETNPANPAIQQELKRLIGRRDGFEPHKVRLTRGALARMYAHGELYPQAIAELKSALDEHKDRPDLQALLARLLWQTDQRTEAAEVSSDLLEKLPYCLQATRIMAAVLQQRGKSNEATAYHRRLAQLDPYMAYTEAPMAEPVRVDADSIMVQKLDWKPGQPLPSTEPAPTDWAASLGLDEESTGPGTGPLPSWLDDVDSSEIPAETTEAAQPFADIDIEDDLFPEAEVGEQVQPESDVEPPTEETSQGEGEIPDWMQEAGWQESSGEIEEQPVSFSAEELDQLERGELPADSGETQEQTGELEPAEIPGWLQGMAPGDEEEAGADDEELEAIFQAESAASDKSDEFDFEQELSEATTSEAEAEESQDVPGWLDEGEPGATSTIMTWLGDREQPADDEDQASSAAETPADEAGMEKTLPEPEQEEEEVPSWLSGVAQAAAESDKAEEQELADFRQQTSRSQVEAEKPEAESIEAGDVPDWLQNITGDVDEADTLSDEDLEQMAAAETELPWEAEVEAAEQDTIPQEEIAAGEIDEDVPDWLAGSDQPEPTESGVTEAGYEAEPLEDEEEEDWLAGLGEASSELEKQPPEEASWLEELSAEEPTSTGSQAESAAPSWMEGLAEEEPEEDEVEARASTWLDDLSETLADTPAEPADTSLDWLDEVQASEAAASEPTLEEQAEEEEDLSWLTSIESEQQPDQAAAAESPTPAAELDEIDEEGVFDWLDQMAAQQEQEPAEEELAIEDQEQTAEPVVGKEAPPETFEEGLDWLDRLSETRGIDADIDREPAAGTISGRLAGSAGTEEPEAETEPERVSHETVESSDWEPEMAEDAASDAPTESKASSEERDEVPTWLLAHGDQEQTAPTAPEAAEPDEGVPAWLLQQAEEEEGSIEPAEAEREPAAEAPDWLAQEFDEPAVATESPQTPAAAEQAPTNQQASADEDAQPEQIGSGTDEEEVPDWLKSQAEDFEAETAGTAGDTAASAESAALEPVPPQTEPAAQESQPAKSGPEEPAETTAAPADVAEFEKAAEAAADREIKPIEPTKPTAVTGQEETASQAAAAVEPPKEAEPSTTRDELTPVQEALAQGDESKAADELATLIKDRTKLEEIITLLEEHLADDPDAPMLWQVLGDAYMRLNKTDKAVRAYDRGMEESEVFDSARQALAASEFERAAAQYGMLIKNKKRLDIVIQDLEQAVEGERSDPRIWQVLGDAYMKADRIDESIEAYRKGMDSV